MGDGTTTSRSTTVQVSGLSGVIAIAGGMGHTIALKSDGTVWAWGANWAGRLGDGTTTDSTTPVQVSGLTSVIAIAGGGYHTIALKSDGTVWAWGYNGNGELGDGTTTDRNTPVQVLGDGGVGFLSGVIAIAGGGNHTIALKSDGTMWVWGHNTNFQLGDGTTTARNTPVRVSSLSGIIAIAGGYAHTVALKSDGTVWAWGWNYYGQLGDGTTTDRNTPVQTVNINVSSPTVKTGTATNVTDTTAALNGLVSASGASTVAWFDYGTEAGVYTGSSTTQMVSGTSATSVSIGVSGLSEFTRYYYRIAGENSYGASYGTETSFTTALPPQPPIVTTGMAASVTLSSAILNGTVNPIALTTTVWFEYGVSSGVYGSSTPSQDINGPADMGVSAGISGLTPWSTYYYRIVAQNEEGISVWK